MHKLISLLMLFFLLVFIASPVFAVGSFNPVPIPGILPLVGIGAVAYLVVRFLKK